MVRCLEVALSQSGENRDRRRKERRGFTADSCREPSVCVCVCVCVCVISYSYHVEFYLFLDGYIIKFLVIELN